MMFSTYSIRLNSTMVVNSLDNASSCNDTIIFAHANHLWKPDWDNNDSISSELIAILIRMILVP